MSAKRFNTQTRKLWQSLACSPPGIAVLPPSDGSETKLSTRRPTKLTILIAAVPSSEASKRT